MAVRKILISGASVSYGYGLKYEKTDDKLWANQIASRVFGSSIHNVDNISVIGIDNREIFLNTAIGIMTNNYSDIFVCWHSIPHTCTKFGLELYNTHDTIIGVTPSRIHKLVAGQETSLRKLQKISEYLLKFYNYHWDINDIISYTNILSNLAKNVNSTIYFINFNLPWDQGYFDKKQNYIPSELTKFTQEVLSTDYRDDEEIYKLYEFIHNEYDKSGGVYNTNWTNLYAPLRQIQVDAVSEDDEHPGYNSQDIFADYLISQILIKRKIN